MGTPAISTPSGSYNHPPNGHVRKCPSCEAILEHFFQSVGGYDEIAHVERHEPVVSGRFANDEAKPPSILDRFVVIDEPAPEVPPLELPPAQQPQLPGIAGDSHPVESKLVPKIDDPRIGGKFTICALLHGDYHHMHRKFLNALISTTPAHRMDLRIACNQVCDATMQYLRYLPITKLYVDDKQRHKYPAMREMFHDPAAPIKTEYVIWFDDDSYPRNANWLPALVDTILQQNPSLRVAQYGQKMRHVLRTDRTHDQRKWFQDATWWRGRHLQNAQGVPSPNGREIHFVVGAFWCILTRAIYECDIPCPRLDHKGGDICISEQLYQHGYNIKSFNQDKKFVHANSTGTRGHKGVCPWMKG